MPAAIPNGGGGEDPTSSQVAAYSAALAKVAGSRSAQEQATITEIEAKVQAIAQGWADSGGTGGRQTAVALEVAGFIGRLEAARLQSVNQWAREAAKGSRKAQAEMHGADTEFIVELARLIFELRERLNDSPY